MAKLGLALLLGGVAALVTLPCDEKLCRPEWVMSMQRGDGRCDLGCNTEMCGFDSKSMQGESVWVGDCFFPCLMTCNYCTHLATTCLAAFAFPICAWDSGKCGYCNLGCTFYSGFRADLGDGVCKAECNTPLCHFDAGDCVTST